MSYNFYNRVEINQIHNNFNQTHNNVNDIALALNYS